MEIESRAKETIAQTIGRDPVEITRCIDFRDEFGLDDLDIIQLAMALEEEFGIQMTDEQTDSCVTLDAIVENIQALTNREAA